MPCFPSSAVWMWRSSWIRPKPSAPIAALDKLKLSANWMAACGTAGEDAALFDTVKAIGMELCPALGIGIPVGKDSLSMKTKDRKSTRLNSSHT